MNRIKSVDILRTIAIIGMIQVHFTYNLSYYYDGGSLLHAISDLIGSFPAPLFTFLVGMSLHLSVSQQQKAGIADEHISNRNLRRGMAIVFIGLLFATLIWMPAEVFNWDILTLIGTSLLILFPLRHLTPRWLLTLSLVIIMFSPLLRIWSDYYRYWDMWGEYINPFNLKGVVLGFWLNGYFPVLPWLAFPLVGYAIGKLCLGKEKAPISKYVPFSAIALIGVAILGLIGSQYYRGNSKWAAGILSDFTFYPASTTFIFIALGIILLLFWFFYTFFDLRETEEGPFLLFSRRYSIYSLTVYFIHHATHVWPLLIAAAVTGKNDQWYYFGEVMPTAYSLTLAFVFVILFYLLIIAWEKKEGKYSLEWLLHKLTG